MKLKRIGDDLVYEGVVVATMNPELSETHRSRFLIELKNIATDANVPQRLLNMAEGIGQTGHVPDLEELLNKYDVYPLCDGEHVIDV